eukprot:570280-Pyramimonas_sp.AAC.1
MQYHTAPYIPLHTIPYHIMPYHTCHTKPHHPTVRCHVLPYTYTPPEREQHRKPILSTWFRAPPTPSREAPASARTVSDTHAIYMVPCTAHIGHLNYLHGFVRFPSFQGGHASARTTSEIHAIYTVSCHSHPSREAPPRRGQYRTPMLITWFRAPSISDTYTVYMVSCVSRPYMEAPLEQGQHRKLMLFTWFRAIPTPPGMPRLSEDSTGNPYYLH